MNCLKKNNAKSLGNDKYRKFFRKYHGKEPERISLFDYFSVSFTDEDYAQIEKELEKWAVPSRLFDGI